jgi:hypothetical protein
MMSIVDVFGEKYRQAKARLQGKAISVARRVKTAKETIKSSLRPGPPRPVAGAYVRMLDGRPMQFYTDGSLRHALGAKPGKAATRRARGLQS